MANTFTHLKYHCVWSKKNWQPLITPNIEKHVWSIVAATAKTHHMHIAKVGGVEDHIHILIEIPKTLSVSEAMKRLKGGSSNAITKAAIVQERFGRQDGYGAFTVSKSGEAAVTSYIANQRRRHDMVSFEDEFVELLEKHGVDYDPQYLWD